ncbi:MAG TPA: universal stress protein [Acidimicrobiaceae bacterium]|jgi:nucleotide-binding universal stress UspA family protein|nr:universal stress protein [Acidimicrobiaceae bacterium]
MTIVVGYIPTPEGRAALEAARREAAKDKVRLVVVNSHKGGASYRDEEAVRADDELDIVRNTLESEGQKFEVRNLVRGNDPTDDLLDIAEEEKASLIVIGIRRRSAIGKLVMGSNAQRILLEADCPVLAVKAPRS